MDLGVTGTAKQRQKELAHASVGSGRKEDQCDLGIGRGRQGEEDKLETDKE